MNSASPLPLEAKRTLRILLVIYAYPPVLGGSEIEAQRVASALLRRGHKVRVLCTGGPEMPQTREWTVPLGVPVRMLTSRSAGTTRDRIFAANVAWNIWADRRSYDLVYFLMQGLHLATGMPAARMAGKAIVLKISGSSIIPMMQKTGTGRFELSLLRRWNVPVMLLNDGMVEEALAAGLSCEQLVWMPNPVDTEEFSPPAPGEASAWRQSHEIDPNSRIVIYVGRLSPEKGLRGLIKGFVLAARDAPGLVLLLVGDGPMRYELEQLVNEFNLPKNRIRFIGRVPVREVPDWLRASDLYALTSPNEGFSCALLEAMSVGLPSLVSDIPANLQLIDPGVHGVTVPPEDETAICAALGGLFRDPESLRRMGKAARLKVLENYTVDKVIARYEELFGSTVNRTATKS